MIKCKGSIVTAAFFAGIIALQGCATGDSCSQYIDEFSGEYEGVAILNMNGNLTLAPVEGCSMVISDTAERHFHLADRFSESPFAGDTFVPVFVHVSGKIMRENAESHVMLAVDQFIAFSLEVGDQEAADQYWKRGRMPPPTRKSEQHNR